MKNHPKESVPDALKALDFNIGVTTAKRRLYAAGLKGRRPAKKPLMDEEGHMGQDLEGVQLQECSFHR